MHHLEVIEGPDAGRRFELPAPEPQLIGRSTEALPFTDPSISRRHAELTPSAGEWWLRDLHSSNGTFVNGSPVLDVVRLRPGDRIRCGDTLMRVMESPAGSRLDTGRIATDAATVAASSAPGPEHPSPPGASALRLAAIGETIATLSHSIKNIMQGLRGGADAVELAIQRGDIERAREGWPVLARNLDRVLALTMNMLAYAKDRPLDIDLDQPNTTVREVAELLGAAARRKRLRLEVNLDPAMPAIPVDSAALHQALVNLATNAIEAAPDRSGEVLIRTRFHPAGPAGPGHCEVTVEDNGPGIPASRRGDLFQPFVSTKGQRGTGLGLAVTLKLAQQHGGSVVHEDRPGGGTRMILNLPAHSDDLDSERTRAPKPLAHGELGISFEE
ncbi:MAG: FHA domain-containing protein [Phycisphaeraceae bacterium]|nr:FHA domain-containing protein [Phycisphaeraceae bacterium]